MLGGRAAHVLGAGLLTALAACGETPAAPQAADAGAAAEAAAGQPPAFDLSGVDLGGVDLAEAQRVAEAAQKAIGSSGLTGAKVLHYTAVGINRAKHVQIPAADADQYGDIVEKVTLEFDWDVAKKALIGAVKITNGAAEVSNLTGMGDECPAGEMKGPFEYFDATEVKPMGGDGALEVVGLRKHPDTMVAESCGAGRKLYKAAQVSVSTPIAPPDPGLFEMLKFAPATPTIRLSADGQSLVMGSLNDAWEWTYTPTVK